MRVGRSLTPGKFFFESGGSLKKIGLEDLSELVIPKNESGSVVILGMLYQWGVSNSPIFVENVRFPVHFSNTPTVMTHGGVSASITQVTPGGFCITTVERRVVWLAVGPSS